MDDKEIDARAPKNGPRVTPQTLTDAIKHAEYFRSDTLTVCVLTLWNGFKVIGESACADPANFDEQLGKEIAFEKAKNQIWALEGYRLKSFLTPEAKMPMWSGMTRIEDTF